LVVKHHLHSSSGVREVVSSTVVLLWLVLCVVALSICDDLQPPWQGLHEIQQVLPVPNRGAGHCLGPEGNGVNMGEGGKGGPGPPVGGKDKQSVLSEGRDNMGKDEEDWASQK
jgi:hypothetical protein